MKCRLLVKYFANIELFTQFIVFFFFIFLTFTRSNFNVHKHLSGDAYLIFLSNGETELKTVFVFVDETLEFTIY